MPNTITSANSVFTLLIPGVFPAPLNLEGYATDDAFSSDSVESSETMMGVDGKMAAGFTPFITPVTIALMANSPSRIIFDTWLNAEVAAKEVFPADATLLIPSIGMSYIMKNGVLRKGKRLPDGKKVLQPVQFTIDWESVTPVPVA